MRKLSLFTTLFLFALVGSGLGQERTITGRVQAEVGGEAITFPQIVVEGTAGADAVGQPGRALGTVGDDDGTFTITGVPPGPVTLVITRIGYLSQRVSVPPGQTDVGIILMSVDYLNVEALVVTGLATEMRRAVLPNAVGSVTGAEINQLPQQTIDAAIVGRVSGALIQRNSGAPGGGFQFNIRGSSSINASAEPVYVIDGVLVSNISIPSNQNELTAAASGSNPSLAQDNLSNRIADLNVRDIESIEILKGPSASAIYGSKATNGVIIITTRRGQVGAPRLTLGFNGGTFDVANQIGLRTFETLEEAESVFAGASDFYQQGVVFDQEQLLTDNNSLSFEGFGNLSGGATGGLNYFGSVLWKEDKGVIDNTGFERQSIRANIASTIGGRADISFNTNVLRTNAQRSITNNGNETAVSHWMIFPATPSFLDLRPEDADLILSYPDNPFATGGVNQFQTAAFLDNDETVFRLIASANLDWNFLESENNSVSLIAPIGVDWFSQDNRIFSPPELHFEPFDGLPGTAIQSESRNLNFNAGANVVWETRPSGGTSITTAAGLQYETRDLQINRVTGRNLTGGKNKPDAGSRVQIRESQSRVQDFGFYGQVELLTLGERLFLVGMIRGDQTSANGDTAKVHIYPKAAISYNIPSQDNFLSNIKLRAAWGQAGNQPLCDFVAGCQKFTSLTVDRFIEGIPGFAIENTVGLGNIEPERTSELEGGVDLTGWGGRLTLGLTGYFQNVTNIILQREVAESTGFDDEFFQGGELENYGVEVDFGLTPFQSQDFTWISRTVWFLNKSNVKNLPEGFEPFVPNNSGFGLDLGQSFIVPGQSITQIAGDDARCLGFQDPMPNCLQGPNDGKRALAQLGDANPDFTFGFTNHFTFWNNLSLYTLFEWRQGQSVVNLTELLFDLVPGFNAPDSPDALNGGTAFDGSLIPPGQESIDDCKPNCNAAERIWWFINGQASAYVNRASFFKAREIALTYTLPSGLIGGGSGFFKEIRIRASGRDLFTVTNYRGLDPEVSNFGSQQVGRSVDVAPFPPSRSFWLGFDLVL